MPLSEGRMDTFTQVSSVQFNTASMMKDNLFNRKEIHIFLLQGRKLLLTSLCASAEEQHHFFTMLQQRLDLLNYSYSKDT